MIYAIPHDSYDHLIGWSYANYAQLLGQQA
jgi:hypothetical protein